MAKCRLEVDTLQGGIQPAFQNRQNVGNNELTSLGDILDEATRED